MGVAVAVGVPEVDTVLLGVGVTVTVPGLLGLAPMDRLAEPESEALGEALRVAVGVALGVALPVGEGVGVSEPVGV